MTGDKISVGAPYFNAVFVPMMLVLLAVLPFGPFMPWKRGDITEAAKRLGFAAVVAVAAAAATLIFAPGGSLLASLGIGTGVWLIFGTLSETAFRVKAFSAPWPEVRRRLSNLPRSSYGGMLAHLGLGITVLGIVATSAWRVENILSMKAGETVQFAGYQITFEKLSTQQGPNYQENLGSFQLSRGGQAVVSLSPSKRTYVAPQSTTSEAAIHASWAGDFYLVMGEAAGEGASVGVRMYFNPLVRFIWIGALIMFTGGAISLADRRLRIGVPARRRQSGAASVAGQAS